MVKTTQRKSIGVMGANFRFIQRIHQSRKDGTMAKRASNSKRIRPRPSKMLNTFDHVYIFMYVFVCGCVRACLKHACVYDICMLQFNEVLFQSLPVAGLFSPLFFLLCLSDISLYTILPS